MRKAMKKAQMRQFSIIAQIVGLDDAQRLLEIARSLNRYNELRCEYELTTRQEAREARLEREAKEIAERHNCFLVLNGDPRVSPVVLLPKEEMIQRREKAYHRYNTIEEFVRAHAGTYGYSVLV